LALAGCSGVPTQGEKSARADVQATGATLLARYGRPPLPALRPDSPPGEFVRQAVLNHPSVAAAYYDWRASVEDVAPARSPADPQFVFQADVGDTLMSLMPGLMFNLMGSGKRAALGSQAVFTAGVARRAYVSAVLDAAAEARKAWVELAYLDEAIRLQERVAGALRSSRALAEADYATGRGMGTLADQVRIVNDLAKARNELAALDDRRTAARVRFKSALGLAPGDPDPAWPTTALAATALPGEDELWRRTLEANPELARMRAMVEMAAAGVEVARKAGHPDFSLGAMAELRADPSFVRPLATLGLPIWRDRIAATVAAAEARHEAGAARVSAEQLNLAAEFAQDLAMVRESDRMIAYIDRDALPSVDRSIATAAAAYQSGAASEAMIPESQVMALAMRLERAGTLRGRELAATDLMLLAAGTAMPVPAP
jgi:outer membrane protein TolC